MFERLKRGWQLTKASFGVLRQDKEILVLPVLAFLSIVLGLAFWGVVGIANSGQHASQTTNPNNDLYFIMNGTE
jgi:uncharacterized membrane protein